MGLTMTKKEYEKGTIGWFRKRAKNDGFDDIRSWQVWKIQQKTLKDSEEKRQRLLKDTERKQQIFLKNIEERFGIEFVDYVIQNKDKIRKCVLNAGCKTEKEYEKLCKENTAKNAGFKNSAEYTLNWLHDKGICIPMSDDKSLSQYFGIKIGECLFKKLMEQVMFEYVDKTGYIDNGIDFICKNPIQEFMNIYPKLKLEKDKEYKIQLKLRCLRRRKSNTIDIGYNEWWDFTHIDYNNKPDFFILCGYNNRYGDPLHIWIFHKDDIIRGDKFWRRDSLTITNKIKYINELQEYELKHFLSKLKELWQENKN